METNFSFLGQFPATVASGAPPRPNHACCEEGFHVCFETLWRRGGGGGLAKEDKIRIRYLTPALSGAHKWEEMLRHPCILDDPQQGGQNQSTKKNKKRNKNKNFPMVSMIQPKVLQITHNGV